MQRTTLALSLLMVICLTPLALQAQVVTGTPPFGSFGGGPEVVNNANLNVHWTIPVFGKPGRGTDFTYDLTYDSAVWYPVTSGGTTTWQPKPNFGWRAVTEVVVGYISYTSTTTSACNGMGQKTTYSNWTYHDSFGVAHWFWGFSTRTQGPPAILGCEGVTTLTSVSDGYTLNVSGGNLSSLYSVDGTRISAPVNTQSGSGSFTDRNGNIISTNGTGNFYDTMSSTSPVLTVTGNGTASSPRAFNYTAPAGSAHYQANYTNYTVATNFASGTIGEYRSSAAVPLLTSIDLPDGSHYTFNYEATPNPCSPYTGTTCTTARLTSITLPTGGQISYAYTLTGCTFGNNGILPDGSASCLQRTTADGIWTYAQSKGSGAASTTTITDPLSKQTVLQFQGIYETQRQVYDGPSTGTVQQTVNTCYNGAASPCTSTAITPPITQRSVISNAPGSTLQTKRVSSWNSFGMPTEIDEYDFGSGAPPSTPLRKTFITYATLANNINAFSQTTTICSSSGAASACGGAGTVVAQTTKS